MIRVIKPSIVHKLKLVRLMGISKQLYSHSISICEDTLMYEKTFTHTCRSHACHMTTPFYLSSWQRHRSPGPLSLCLTNECVADRNISSHQSYPTEEEREEVSKAREAHTPNLCVCITNRGVTDHAPQPPPFIDQLYPLANGASMIITGLPVI